MHLTERNSNSPIYEDKISEKALALSRKEVSPHARNYIDSRLNDSRSNVHCLVSQLHLHVITCMLDKVWRKRAFCKRQCKLCPSLLFYQTNV